MTFCALDVIRHKKRWSVVGLCCGAVAGLVGITPASGYIPIYFSVPVGVISTCTIHLAMGVRLSLFRITHMLKLEQTSRIFSALMMGSMCLRFTV
jgi:Amt family ammonium transporter